MHVTKETVHSSRAMVQVIEESGGSVVECLTRDPGVGGPSLTGGTTLCL